MKIIFVFLFIFLFVGCSFDESPSDNIGFKIIPSDNPYLEGYQPWIFSGEEITDWFSDQMIVSKSFPRFSPWLDSEYFVWDYNNAIKAFKIFSKKIENIQYVLPKRDCDDFAFAFKSWAQFLYADTYDIRAAAPVAVLFVIQENDFGGVPGTGRGHAVIGIGTNKGPVILEPQTGAYVLLENYPNKEHIFYVIR